MLKSSYIAHNPVILWLETLQYLFWESLEISNATKFQVKYICYLYSTFPLRCLRWNWSLQCCRTFSSTPCQVHRMDLQNTGCSSMLTNCGLGKWQLSKKGDQATQDSIQIYSKYGFQDLKLGNQQGILMLTDLIGTEFDFFAEWHRKIEAMLWKNRVTWCVLALLSHGLRCYWLLPSIAWHSLNRFHSFTTFHLLLQHHLESGDSLEEMVLHGDKKNTKCKKTPILITWVSRIIIFKFHRFNHSQKMEFFSTMTSHYDRHHDLTTTRLPRNHLVGHTAELPAKISGWFKTGDGEKTNEPCRKKKKKNVTVTFPVSCWVGFLNRIPMVSENAREK